MLLLLGFLVMTDGGGDRDGGGMESSAGVFVDVYTNDCDAMTLFCCRILAEKCGRILIFS